MLVDVKLPEIGDSIESGDVLEVLVREGDRIERDQGIVELETDKATGIVPSPRAGMVTKVHVRAGDTVPVGATLITVQESAVDQAAVATGPAAPEPVTAPLRPSPETAPPGSVPVAEPTPLTPMPTPVTPTPTPVQAETATAESIGEHDVLPAGPAVRRFAREVGVDLHSVAGTGPGGRITRDDVLQMVRQASEAVRRATVTTPSPADLPGQPSTDRWGPVRIEKMTRIRKTIAGKMHESWSTVPRVTNFDDADITELERIRQSSKADYAHKGIKLTILPFVVKAAAMALKDHPLINASLDMAGQQIIYKQYINIGIAVDTERGLVVPSLRGADRLSIPDIARQLATIADNVRDGNFSVDDLRGSTFTISNLGAVGGTYSTPIINVPEVAVLLVGRSRKMPVVVSDQIATGLMMPLSLSYDHRLVDGATAARFLNDVIAYLEAPARLLLAP